MTDLCCLHVISIIVGKQSVNLDFFLENVSVVYIIYLCLTVVCFGHKRRRHEHNTSYLLHVYHACTWHCIYITLNGVCRLSYTTYFDKHRGGE